ncbi:hypothetical protein EC5905_3412 [Escherichia coli 5905]|nr:hypothetical protein EC5905_3412 [Escherichia coli 5905]KDU19261.1 hypothetical protein AB18_2311 [Escherichia coli 3-267-03_S1_C1]
MAEGTEQILLQENLYTINASFFALIIKFINNALNVEYILLG